MNTPASAAPGTADERRSILLSDSQFSELRAEQVAVKATIDDHVTGERAWQDGISLDVSYLRQNVDALTIARGLLELEVRGVAAGLKYTTDQMVGLSATVTQQSASTHRLEAGLEANTRMTAGLVTMTRGISDVLAAGRVASGAVTWLGSMAKPLMSIALLVGGAYAASRGMLADMWRSALDLWKTIGK